MYVCVCVYIYIYIYIRQADAVYWGGPFPTDYYWGVYTPVAALDIQWPRNG